MERRKSREDGAAEVSVSTAVEGNNCSRVVSIMAMWKKTVKYLWVIHIMT
jgi:hypothetical protein